jgi:hypothetical protein
LRLSTLLLGAVALYTVYSLALDAGTCRAAALLATATVAVNPVFFQLSNTFMTDVRFIAMVVARCLARQGPREYGFVAVAGAHHYLAWNRQRGEVQRGSLW